jgi:predicted AlkP superfamily pyrophosphatase or phosphodiesterase
VDYNAEIFAAAREFLRATPRPNVTIYQFVTPDHQAHACGVFSEKYRAHIRGFDKELEALLGEIPADTTVILTSDHGAAASGTHGTRYASRAGWASALQRCSSRFATANART